MHVYDEPGGYYVCLSVRNEIDGDTYCRFIQVDTMMMVGTLELRRQGKVAVFPNPAKGQLNFHGHRDGHFISVRFGRGAGKVMRSS